MLRENPGITQAAVVITAAEFGRVLLETGLQILSLSRFDGHFLEFFFLMRIAVFHHHKINTGNELKARTFLSAPVAGQKFFLSFVRRIDLAVG